MSNKRPLILITNDDGYQAKGIKVLTDAVRGLGDVVVFAPDSHRSGMSSAITIFQPIRCYLHRQEEGVLYYHCTGTPVDCVKLALNHILDRKPDLIISGINHGPNAGISVIYSGTMGAAIEGCIANIPSFGISLCAMEQDPDFSHCAQIASQMAGQLLANGLPQGVCLNVNVPQGKVKGIRVAAQTAGKWVNEYVKGSDGLGCDVYWMTGSFENWDHNNDTTDEWMLANHYAAVVPVKIDMTAYDFIPDLKAMLLSDSLVKTANSRNGL